MHSFEVPALKYVGGNFFIKGSTAFDCAPLQQLYVNGVVKGSFTCIGAATSSTSPTTTASTTTSNAGPSTAPATPDPATTSSVVHSSSSSGGLSAGAKGGIAAGVIVAFLLLAGLVIFLIWRRRKRATPEPAELAASESTFVASSHDATSSSHEAMSQPVSELPARSWLPKRPITTTPSTPSELQG